MLYVLICFLINNQFFWERIHQYKLTILVSLMNCFDYVFEFILIRSSSLPNLVIETLEYSRTLSIMYFSMFCVFESCPITITNLPSFASFKIGDKSVSISQLIGEEVFSKV